MVRALVLTMLLLVPFVRPSAAAGVPAEVPVFAFHRVDTLVPKDPIGNQLTETPAQFEAELRYLQAHHIRTVTASELVERLAHGEPVDHTAVLTFDDGYLDARTQALPLLQKYGDKATFYVIKDTIGTPNHLRWSDIRELLRAGMEIGAHGTDHLDLSQMSPKEQTAQVMHVLDAVEHYTGVRPKTYAYPSGQYNAATLAIMKKAGIEAAFTMQYGTVRSLSKPYQLPRVRINRSSAQTTFTTACAAR